LEFRLALFQVVDLFRRQRLRGIAKGFDLCLGGYQHELPLMPFSPQSLGLAKNRLGLQVDPARRGREHRRQV
jgi:hypothetical protein